MSIMTTKLAQRASKDTSLVACLIDSYSESMNLRWEEIANFLWIDIHTLAKLALCRRPRPTSYSEDISQVADYIGMDPNQLKDFIRNAEVASVERPKSVNAKPKPAKQKSKSNRGLIFAFAAATVVLVVLSAFVFLQPTSASSPGTIHVVRGQATVFKDGSILGFITQDGKVVPTGELMTVREGDTIQISEVGLARLKLGDGSTVDLLAGTNLKLTELDTSEDTYQVRLGLVTGKAVSRVRRLLNAGDSFEVISPSSTVSVRGTVFAVEVISPSVTYVACNEGIVQVLMGDQVVELKANQELTAVVGEPLEVQPLSIWEEPDPTPACDQHTCTSTHLTSFYARSYGYTRSR